MLIKCVAPIRAESGKNVPIGIIIVNDTNTIAHIKQVEINSKYQNPPLATRKTTLNIDINESHCSHEIKAGQSCCEIFFIECENGYSGKMLIDVKVNYDSNSKFNKHNKFETGIQVDIYINTIPTLPGWYHGTCYTPNNFSQTFDDLVVLLGKSMGLSWVIAVKNDPLVNQHEDKIVDGFEFLSGRLIDTIGSYGNRIQLLAVEISDLITSYTKLASSLEIVSGKGGLSFAAGPFYRKGTLIQKLFSTLWRTTDLESPKLNGIIFSYINLADDLGAFYSVRSLWVEQLLHGKFLSPLTNGTFASEVLGLEKERFIGSLRTVIHCGNNFNTASIIKALKDGNLFVTQGPFVLFTLKSSEGLEVTLGETIYGTSFDISIHVKTSPEFGRFDEVMVIVGDITTHEEEILFFVLDKWFKGDNEAQINEENILNEVKISKGYIRIEVITKKGDQSFFAFTNPIWVNKLQP